MIRLSFLVSVIMAAVLVPSGAPRACSATHVASECLRPLDSAEMTALTKTVHALSLSADQRCRQLGEFIGAHAGDARIMPYPILTRYGLATGDAHSAEDPVGSGRVHVADSVLTRDGALARPVSAKIHTLVHDFAHLVMKLPQEHYFLGGDPAGDVAEACSR